MASKRQVAANQLRSINSLIDRIDKLATGFEDVDQYMVGQAEELRQAAERYKEELEEIRNEQY